MCFLSGNSFVLTTFKCLADLKMDISMMQIRRSASKLMVTMVIIKQQVWSMEETSQVNNQPGLVLKLQWVLVLQHSRQQEKASKAVWLNQLAMWCGAVYTTPALKCCPPPCDPVNSPVRSSTNLSADLEFLCPKSENLHSLKIKLMSYKVHEEHIHRLPLGG